jgi:hypothetical protein
MKFILKLRKRLHADADATSGNQTQLHTDHVLCLTLLLLVSLYSFHYPGGTHLAAASRIDAKAPLTSVQCCMCFLPECVGVHAYWEHQCIDIERGR